MHSSWVEEIMMSLHLEKCFFLDNMLCQMFIDVWTICASEFRCIPGVTSRGDACECRFHCWKADGKHGTTVTCLRTHYGQQCKQFSGQNALDCRIFQIQTQNISGSDTPDPIEASPVFGPTHQFCLVCQRSHCFYFTKRSLLQTSWCN